MFKELQACPSCGSMNGHLEKHCAVCGENLASSYFDVLRLRPEANVDAIHKAYLKAAARCHPDKTVHLSAEQQNVAALKMQQLNYIWELLKDPDKRDDYIFSLHYPFTPKTPEQDDAWQQSAYAAWCYRAFPMRRGLARLIDYIGFGVLCFLLIWLLFPAFEQWPAISMTWENRGITIAFAVLAISLTSLIWAALEAFLIARFATTPGKWLLHIRILDNDHNPLTMQAALPRALSVWVKGMACGFVPLIPLVWAYWHRMVSKESKDLPWDELVQSEVLVDEPSHTLVYAILSAMILIPTAGLLYLNWPTISKAVVMQTSHIVHWIAPLNSTDKSRTAERSGVSTADDYSTAAESVAKIESTPTSGLINTPATPTAAEQQELVLPPPMQSPNKLSQPLTNATSNLKITATEPPPAKSEKISEERRISCMTRYFEATHQAADLPLGDYVRLEREAREELDRCLR